LKIDAFSLPFVLNAIADWLASVTCLTPTLSRISTTPLYVLSQAQALAKDVLATGMFRLDPFSDNIDSKFQCSKSMFEPNRRYSCFGNLACYYMAAINAPSLHFLPNT
jgi:hypothetical protein